jgi:DnaJ-class molecular chaperone
MECPTCKGKGKVYVPAGKTYEACGRCDGSGEVAGK